MVESKNISKNQYLNCSKQKSHWNNENINKQEKGNSSLRKKKKIYFNVEKNSEQKPVFITTKINKILRFGTNNIKYDNKTIINNKNFISQESSFSKEAFEKIFPKKEKAKLFYTIDYNLFKKPEEESKNRGRWSYDEHIKFIKAYINFGKNYKLSQKYIGTRNKKQIKSHAQKFFKKLKRLKNKDFDFSDDNIKNFSDIFQLIEEKNKNNVNKEEYIINILISLSNSIKKTKNNFLNKKTKFNFLNNGKKLGKENETKVDKIKKDPSLNNEKNIKRDNVGKLPKIRNNIKEKKLFCKNYKINNDILNSNLNLKEDEINEKEFDLGEIDINKAIDKGQNEKKEKNVIFENKNNICGYYGNEDINLNKEIKFSDDFLFLAGDSDLYRLDRISFDSDEFQFEKSKYSPIINFICDYNC